MSEDQRSLLKSLISKGKEQGYLTFAEVNDHLPNDLVDPEQIEDIIGMFGDMGIAVHEHAPDSEDILLSDTAVTTNDEDEAEEAAAALASSVDGEIGRTTDPVRMYMREMGTVELLTREGEISIAKRIEEGQLDAFKALASLPASIAYVLSEYARIATPKRVWPIWWSISSIRPSSRASRPWRKPSRFHPSWKLMRKSLRRMMMAQPKAWTPAPILRKSPSAWLRCRNITRFW